MDFSIREACKEDLQSLLQLYTQLHDNPMPAADRDLGRLWERILADTQHHILVGFLGDMLVCSCVLMIIPNLTHSQRPYALIENVITDEKQRNKGFASAMMSHAREIAVKENCYKIMLMTSSKEDATLNFYQRSGYNRRDKTAFIQWL
ncbi:MAG: GNAT family N-acetyltransferase [Clostridia bacterium]|nr:GNAT family N-acetyltransferase [Clostridia bacterium]MDR3643584.1 GNAT family N-acetyltransferase [Clostridia bacterium]